MERDEIGVLNRQKANRRDVVDPAIQTWKGKTVKTTGDGMLVQFDSAIDAVMCGIEIQTAMANREADIALDGRIRHRIGINIGDIILEDDDIYGDGVNVAARLEMLAEPGGICISDAVHQVSAHKTDIKFQDFGLQKVKNILRPVHVWRWLPDAVPRDPSPNQPPA